MLWNGVDLGVGYRLDLVVNECLVVEVKSVTALAPVRGKQVLTYLRLGSFRLGLLLNFGAPRLVQGIKRIANGLP